MENDAWYLIWRELSPYWDAFAQSRPLALLILGLVTTTFFFCLGLVFVFTSGPVDEETSIGTRYMTLSGVLYLAFVVPAGPNYETVLDIWYALAVIALTYTVGAIAVINRRGS